jgi:hypothetical protein
LPAFPPKEIDAPFAGPGDAVLPRKHTAPLQDLERFGDRRPGTAGLLGDPFVGGEAYAGRGVVEAPQQRPQDLQEGAGDRTLVLGPGWRCRARA